MGKAMARHGQTMHAHLSGVSALAAGFAAKFGCPAWGGWIGEGHDWRKYDPRWQQYLLTSVGRENHAYESAAEYWYRYGNLGLVAAYAIAGHHTHLPNYTAGLDHWKGKQVIPDGCIEWMPSVDFAVGKKALLNEFSAFLPDPESYHLWIRMLFSALVDADRLNAEAAVEPAKTAFRRQYESFEQLEEKFDAYLTGLQQEAVVTSVNASRRAILAEVLQNAERQPGFFSLNVPTGGGKTLASMAFALRHRRKFGLDRVIMAIPYCSIIEQTAAIYRKIFGAVNVLEHHADFIPFDDDKKTELSAQRELAVENWDMPIVVTTNVQLLESLLGANASQVRKVHNIARSVVILDEVQMLPPDHLRPILSVLRMLVKHFGCSVVLCSATLPSLEAEWIGPSECCCPGVSSVYPLISDPEKWASELCRVRLERTGRLSRDALAARLDNERQALCIVNTKAGCRELFHALHSENKYHLSAAMCPVDRSCCLARIRADLAGDRPVVVVATQVVEAGVDFDFPVVCREWAGLDSLAQAAGRCNREGKLEYGRVILFESENRLPTGTISHGVEVAKQLPADFTLTPQYFREYFEKFYHCCCKFKDLRDFDKAKFNKRLVEESKSLYFSFHDFALDFHLIDDAWQVPVVTAYREGAGLIQELREKGPSRERFRAMQPYTVNVPKKRLEWELEVGRVAELFGVYVQNTPNWYREGVGVELGNDELLMA
ncbi:CRISPR-associated helicase Cas3' [Victivallis sp. Marseille-Q1083]|uniref:CRISPR-associated helicase Cas3' n=1 Tax=Victivallis sp. Marseille-Q1083 TaxID=2717288 RepID=UPI00158E6DFF|nr:CRISPR-associated helicase Cas3' [Victivallis sp. Marseille-Q1083]